MAKWLYTIGRIAATHAKKVLIGTIVALLALGATVMTLGTEVSSDLSIPGTKAEQATDYIQEQFSDTGTSGARVTIVFKAPEGKTLLDPDVTAKVTEVMERIQKDDATHVQSYVTPYMLQQLQFEALNEQKTIGFGFVTFNQKAIEVSQTSKASIERAIEISRDAGIQTELTGDVKFAELHIGGIGESIGVFAAYAILAFTFLSFLAAGLPILIAIIGLGLGLLIVFIGTNFFEIQSTSFSLAAMLGLAVGIDYSLFIMTGFREHLRQGRSVIEAIALATGTAGSAVLFAGLTVIIGLLGLAVTDIPFLTAMGVTGAIAVFTGVLTALLVLPALLGLLGERIAHSNPNRFLSALVRKTTRSEKAPKLSGLVTQHPFKVLLIAISILVFIALPVRHLNLGLPSDGTSKHTDQTERRSFDLLQQGFGEGYNAPLYVVVKDKAGAALGVEQFQAAVSALAQTKDVAKVIPLSQPKGSESLLFQVIPSEGPDATSTESLVKKLRNTTNVEGLNQPVELMVAGVTALNIDISDKLNDALPLFATLIVILAYVLLVLVFRSLLVPLKAVLGFLLSMAATLGFVVWVLQDGYLIDFFGFPATSPVLAFLPVIAIGILFGLAMDYEVFLVSKMREEYVHNGGDASQAVVDGMRHSGKVVVSAALIMIVVFFGFMMTPDMMVRAISMALAFGIIFDAFIVRLLIVPAVMKLLGKSAWYLPQWLDRVLPNVDIEGESILKQSK